jgi:multiple antibiotic resistance protein
MNYFTLILTLLLIINPLGNAKQFLDHLNKIRPAKQRKTISRELLYSLLTMFVFSFLGEWIFGAFGISRTTAYIASGLILLLTSIKILFPKAGEELKAEEEPNLVPIAIPMITSPALLATIMLYASTEPSLVMMNGSIVIAWVITSFIYLGIRTFFKVVGASGFLAMERLMGMVLILLAVQRIMEGLLLFVANKP